MDELIVSDRGKSGTTDLYIICQNLLFYFFFSRNIFTVYLCIENEFASVNISGWNFDIGISVEHCRR